MSSDEFCHALRLFLLNIYIDPTDITNHDAGKNFMVTAFPTRSSALQISTKAVPVEVASLLAIVERYHASVRRVYRILQHESTYFDEKMDLQIDVKTINDTVGPEGLVTTLSVYGVLPSTEIATEKPAASTYQHVVAMHKALKVICKCLWRGMHETYYARATGRPWQIRAKYRSEGICSYIDRNETSGKVLMHSWILMEKISQYWCHTVCQDSA